MLRHRTEKPCRRALPARSSSWSCVLLLAATTAVVADDASRGDPRASRRAAWTTSRFVGTPEAPLPYVAELAFPELRFTRPVTITSTPGMKRLFVVEVDGRVSSFPVDPSVAVPDLAIDLKADRPRLSRAYGLTFHPDFERNRVAYLCYVLEGGDPARGSRVSRFRMTDAEPPVIDSGSEEVIYAWPAGGHNGGCLKFGPDGYLYISTGDGTGPNPPDPDHVGQDLTNVYSSILRIDVDRRDGDRAYVVPPDNPFVALPGARPEIWAYGFRNPWKVSFDAQGRLWVGDVGWEMWEMIYIAEKGGNYGWSVTEGRQPIHLDGKRGPTPIRPPIVDHDHFEARSITGGFVYRGPTLAELAGAYLYGDYSTGRVWGLRFDGERVTWHRELARTSLQIVAFGEDARGELYFLDYERTGGVYRFVLNPRPDRSDAFPRRLSETGLFASVVDETPALGVVPYRVNAELFQDGARARRVLALPGGAAITGRQPWVFPDGTVAARTVSLDMELDGRTARRRVETQVLHLEAGEWRPYVYVWNDARTDAVLDDGSGQDLHWTVRDARGERRKLVWRVASRAECSVCHTDKLGSVLGLRPLQLAGPGPRRDRPEKEPPGRGDQLDRWLELGLLAEPPARRQKPRSHLVDPYDTALDLNDRARSYLHVNCGHCHRPGGGGTSMIHLDGGLPLEKTLTVDALPSQGDFAVAGARIIRPGDPYASVLYYRLSCAGPGKMPKLGNSMFDARGDDLVHDWIASLAAESPDPPVVEQQREIDQRLAVLRDEAASGTARTEAVRRLLSSSRGALVLSRRLQVGDLPPSIRPEVIELATAHREVPVRELFDRFLPPGKRTPRLGASIDPDEILSLRGDASSGRRTFFFGGASTCRTCHRIAGSGGSVGPGLDAIGEKYGRVELLRTITHPSERIEERYLTWTIVTRAGDSVSGVLVATDEASLLIGVADGRQVRVPIEDVAERRREKTSLMPEGLLKGMTAQEAADLLEFLVSRRTSGSEP